MGDLKEILDSVHLYYSEAFNVLVLYTLAIIAFVGVLIPILVAFFQNRTFRSELEKKASEIEAQTRLDIDTYFDKKEEELLAVLNSKSTEIQLEMKKLASSSEAGIYHIQAQNNFDKSYYFAGLKSAITSAVEYVNAEDELNMQRVIKVAESCLLKLHEDEMESRRDDIVPQEESLIKKINGINSNGRYDDLVRSLKRNFANARKRKRKESEEE